MRITKRDIDFGRYLGDIKGSCVIKHMCCSPCGLTEDIWLPKDIFPVIAKAKLLMKKRPIDDECPVSWLRESIKLNFPDFYDDILRCDAVISREYGETASSRVAWNWRVALFEGLGTLVSLNHHQIPSIPKGDKLSDASYGELESLNGYWLEGFMRECQCVLGLPPDAWQMTVMFMARFLQAMKPVESLRPGDLDVIEQFLGYHAGRGPV